MIDQLLAYVLAYVLHMTRDAGEPMPPVPVVVVAPAPVASPPAPTPVILPELGEAPATDSPMCGGDAAEECWEPAPDDVVTWDRPYSNPLPTPPHSAPPSEGD